MHLHMYHYKLAFRKKNNKRSACESLPHKYILGKHLCWLHFSEDIQSPKILKYSNSGAKHSQFVS